MANAGFIMISTGLPPYAMEFGTGLTICQPIRFLALRHIACARFPLAALILPASLPMAGHSICIWPNNAPRLRRFVTTLVHVLLSGCWIISRQIPIAVLFIARKCNRTRQAGLQQAVPLQGYARLPRLVLAMVFLMGLAGLTQTG